MEVTVLVFAVELQKVRTKCIFLRFLRGDWGEFQNRMYVNGEESIKKSVFREFTSRYHI